LRILFRTKKLGKLCNSSKLARQKWGDVMARRLRARLDDLDAAEVLEDLRNLPHVRCHELTGERKGQFSLDLQHPYRLLCVPADDPVPRKPDGGLDWSRVTAVEILEVADTHG